jgi:hypothetical protein
MLSTPRPGVDAEFFIYKLRDCRKRREELLPVPPSLFRSVLWKLEASFLDDEQLLDALLSTGIHSFANEFKFVQCSGLNDELLARISKVRFIIIISLTVKSVL